MAMFGGLSRKKTDFGMPDVYSTPGIGDGLPGMPGYDPGLGAPPSAIPAQVAPQKFGARDIVGIIGDALSAAGGGQGVYTQMKLRDREQQRQQMLAQAQRQQGMSDWLAKEQWERANPKPAAPTELERLAVAAGYQPGTPEYQSALRQGFQNKTDPFQAVTTYGPDGSQSLQFYRSSQIGRGGDQSVSPSPGAMTPPPASAGPDSNFMTVDQYDAVRQGLGSGFSAWATKHQVPVLVNSAEDMARVPAGTPVVSPDGRRGVKK